jgi:two-component system, OmpR family, sensor histidine kinase KdpD
MIMMDGRPDPDQLLRRVEAEEKRSRHGKLSVFFGAAPGVGKTYAMLQAAGSARVERRDVVVGLVETHGRFETAALLGGLELLPPLVRQHHGIEVEELDLDAALARRPELLLVDELAHTNAEGSRHPKRWQDVEELLEAGIDVLTTLNVQHVESLNDVVARITGVVVRETVPDSVLEQAHAIKLVDLPPDDLLERLREGKVYVPAQAQRAIESFFRKGNLIALRELALRQTAERVDAQMQAYRREHGIEQSWGVAEQLIVAVSPSPSSARLVRAARRMAGALHARWFAVYVEPNRARGLSPAESASRPWPACATGFAFRWSIASCARAVTSMSSSPPEIWRQTNGCRQSRCGARHTYRASRPRSASTCSRAQPPGCSSGTSNCPTWS